jgi:M6 family metalloprotease-like protein
MRRRAIPASIITILLLLIHVLIDRILTQQSESSSFCGYYETVVVAYVVPFHPHIPTPIVRHYEQTIHRMTLYRARRRLRMDHSVNNTSSSSSSSSSILRHSRILFDVSDDDTSHDYYHPQYIPLAECQYLTATQCRYRDEFYRIYYRNKQRRMMERRQQRTLNEGAGNFNYLVLLIQFPGHEDRVLPPRSYFDAMCNGPNPNTNSVGSISEYFAWNSNGIYTIQCQVMDWQVTDLPESSYAHGVSGVGDPGTLQGIVAPVLDRIRDQINFAALDNNNDGLIELMVFHSGFGAEATTTQDCTGTSTLNLLQSQAYAATIPEESWSAAINFINYRISSFAIASAYSGNGGSTVGSCVYEPATMGIITHELLHTFGTFDLDDPTASASGPFMGGIGAYCLMSTPYGYDGNNLARPSSISSYTKYNIGWVVPTEIIADGIYEIGSAASTTDVYLIRLRYAENEYLMIENRQPERFDSDIYGNGGLVIYHIDESKFSVDSTGQETPGFPGQEGWPENGNHYRVAVLQRDGLYDLENYRNVGDEGDLWIMGYDLLPGDGGMNYPNTDSYQNGTIISTGITISEISESNAIMTFRVTGLSTVAPSIAPTSTAPTTSAPTLVNSDAPSDTPSQVPTVFLSEVFPSPFPTTMMEDNADRDVTESPTTSTDARRAGLLGGFIAAVTLALLVLGAFIYFARKELLPGNRRYPTSSQQPLDAEGNNKNLTDNNNNDAPPSPLPPPEQPMTDVEKQE